MQLESKGAAFRRLHEEPGAFVISRSLGYRHGTDFGSHGFSCPRHHQRRHGVLSRRRRGTGVAGGDTLNHCRAIAAATPLPVSADLEKGLGDSPQSASETIQAAAGIGLAGCSLEDHTGRRDDPIYDFELAVERIEAAAQACRALPDDFVLTARCENFLWWRPDLDDTIRRLQAFEKAGADVLDAPGLHDLGMIRRAIFRRPRFRRSRLRRTARDGFDGVHDGVLNDRRHASSIRHRCNARREKNQNKRLTAPQVVALKNAIRLFAGAGPMIHNPHPPSPSSAPGRYPGNTIRPWPSFVPS